MSQQVKVKTSLSHYAKNILNNIVSLEAFNILLEQLGEFDYHGCSNKITFMYKGKKFMVSFLYKPTRQVDD